MSRVKAGRQVTDHDLSRARDRRLHALDTLRAVGGTALEITG